MQLLSVPFLVTLQLFTVFFGANRVAWRPSSPVACDGSEQVLSSLLPKLLWLL